MKNKVTKKDCMEAIEYLFVMGYVEEMTTDKKYYTKILLKKVANDYNIELIDEDHEDWQEEITGYTKNEDGVLIKNEK
jgi:tRNA G46 methylase TrmB